MIFVVFSGEIGNVFGGITGDFLGYLFELYCTFCTFSGRRYRKDKRGSGGGESGEGPHKGGLLSVGPGGISGGFNREQVSEPQRVPSHVS